MQADERDHSMPLIQSYALPQTVPDTMLLSLKNVVKLLENKEKKIVLHI